MQHLAPTGVRRHGRPRAFTLVALGVIVSGSVAMASPASAAPIASNQTAFVLVAAQHAQSATMPDIPVQTAFINASRAAVLADKVSALRATAASITSNRASVRAGDPVQLSGAVTYGRQQLRVRSDVVNLQVKSGDTWNTVASRPIAGNGYAVFTVRPTRSSTYRLSYPGPHALAGSTSAPTAVTVTTPSPATATSPSSGSAKPSGSSTSSGAAAPASTAPPALPAGSGRGAQVVAAAAAMTGKPYQYGAAGPNAFDCSGLTMYAFGKVGISLPHNADAQKSYGTAVSQAAALPGDLIIFLSGGTGYHAAIYAGNGYMYDAPNSGSTVGLHKIYSGTVIFRRLV